MSAPSPLLRLLQTLAIGLAIAIVVLLALLSRQEIAVPPAPGGPDAATAPAPAESVVAAARDASRSGPAPMAPTAPQPTKAPEPQGCVLFGTIKRADSAPPRGQLWLTRDGKQLGSASIERRTFVFPGLAPGKYVLRARIEDELPLEREVLVRAPRTRVDIELPAAWRLTVNAVTPAGTPLLDALPVTAGQTRGFSNLTVLAFREPPGELPLSNRRTTVGGLGEFHGHEPFRGKLPPKQTIGILTLPLGAPVHVALVLRSTILATTPATPAQEELTFVLSPEAFMARLATVRLRVVDATGAPVTMARVAMSDAQGGGGGQMVDGEGRVTLANLTPGILDLDIGAKDLCGPPVRIEVRSGVDLDLGDVQLVPPVQVEFDLAGTSGDDFLRVTWLDPPARAGWQSDVQGFSGSGGRCTLNLFPGRHGMYYRTKAGCAVLEIDTRALPAQPIRIPSQQTAALAVRVEANSGLARLRLCSAGGTELMDSPLQVAWEFTFQIPQGDYTAEITDLAGKVVRRPVHVGANGAELNLP